MSEFGSCCDFCGTMLFKIDCSGGDLNLLFSHNYYSCISCHKINLCYDCYSKVTGREETKFLKLLNNKVSCETICENHNWEHSNAFELN